MCSSDLLVRDLSSLSAEIDQRVNAFIAGNGPDNSIKSPTVETVSNE